MSDFNQTGPAQNESSAPQSPVFAQIEPPTPQAQPSNRNWMVVAVMAIVLIAMIAVIVHNAPSGSGGRGLIGRVAGKPAPDFVLKDLNTGQTVRLSDYRGKAVLLNFWATWCPPCKVEIPWFVDLQKQYGPEGLAVVSVAVDDSGENAIADFAKQMGINYPVLVGTEQVENAYGGVDGLPTTFYIGRDGKIVERVEGLRSHYEIESNIKAALAQGTPVAQQTSAQ